MSDVDTGISSDTVGNGGRKSGIYSGGSQLEVRARFRLGDEGLEIGDSGRGGEDGGGCRFLWLVGPNPSPSLSPTSIGSSWKLACPFKA